MSSINIILFGETGVGKSSVINLIAGRTVADTSPNVRGCTMSSQQYAFTVGGRRFCIWDTVGLEEPEMGVNGYLAAIENALELIQQLSQRGGVSLLLFCIRGNRITSTTQSNYRLFYEVLCNSDVPISLVITNVERESNMEDWWARNHGGLEKYGIKSAGHACVTGLPYHSKYEDSKVAIQNLLAGCDGEGKYTMPSEAWFIQFLRLFGMFAPPKNLKGKKLLEILTKRCKLNEKVAQEIAQKLERQT